MSTSAACEQRVTEVSPEESMLIVEPLVQAVRERFIEWEMATLGSSKTRKVRTESWQEMHDTPRHFAGCSESGLTIAFAPEIVELPEETVLGILAHEFGHSIDFLYPGRFVLRDREVIGWREMGGEGKREAQAARAAIRQWQQRDPDQVEFDADAIAQYVTGQTIGYSGPCMLQGLNAGARRPQGLR